MFSFWKPVYNHRHIIKTVVSPGKVLFLYIKGFSVYVQSFCSKKRMSFFSPLFCRKQRASMAVEASAALPFFLFFLLNILSSFEMLRLHGNLTAAMHQTGNRMAFYGYAYKAATGNEAVLTEGMDSLILSVGYAKSRVIGILGTDYLEGSCLADGVSGLHFIKSSVMERNDIIELVASYRVKPFFSLMGFPDLHMENRYYGRAWTGYDVAVRQSDMSAEDPVVYIAEHGTVYHLARNCSYLSPSIEAIPSGAVDELRNTGGGKYTDCDRCKRNKYQAVVYITSQGNKAHGSLQCAGLKRTIYLVLLSEVGGRGRCSKCGS